MTDRTFKFLLISRVTRSISLIYVSLSIPLYLSLLGLSPVTIGLIVFGVVGFYASLSFGLGMLGDRIGYKKSLIIGDLLPLIGTALLAVVTSVKLIIPLLIITGIGGGASGGLRGMWSPGISALIASNWRDEKERVKRLGLISSAASAASIIGSLLISIKQFLPFSSLEDYRFIFGISSLLLFVSVISLVFVEEAQRPKKTTKIMKKSSLNYILRVIASNAVTGAGIGLAIPLLPLWFKIAYHANDFEIGLVFTFSYALTSIGSFLATRIKFDTLKIASITRVLNGVLLIGIAFSPWFYLASALYALRGLNAGIGAPNRTAINVRGVSEEDYGTATSLQGISTRIAQLSSGLSGYLLETWIPLPELSGGILQAIGGYIYYRLLKEKRKATSS
ncbi:MFS transporter [Sulfurisphaera ohwakuensis]|uniref:MFS family permease n=1 Tax=Sulfurisphaera ohwakuensis TaxID=69656 RepID=A0A650CKM6_SULOH|nr:MFS transporter [Sulfurisphaera ohwakuensis]MBB5254637.1 MFS family permease [Sulfurisphaera ohwakuensis]QGR18027.1 MFS transporter [Sulfurisphaera ohwakuensis]